MLWCRIGRHSDRGERAHKHVHHGLRHRWTGEARGVETHHRVGLRGVPDKLVLVVGTEGAGLTTELLEASDARVRIPMRAGSDSVNVATALAIALQRCVSIASQASLAGAGEST